MDEKCPMYVREGFTLIDELAGQGIDGKIEYIYIITFFIFLFLLYFRLVDSL